MDVPASPLSPSPGTPGEGRGEGSAHDAADRRNHNPDSATPPPQKPCTTLHVVLIVDDDPDHCRAVATLLRRDYRVLTATSAAEALGILDREPVHLILSDQRMPDMTGVEFLARAKVQQPDAVRLLCTGYADAADAIAAINDGHVFRFLTKPVSPRDLQSALRDACERYDLIAERKQLLVQLQRKNDELERANQQLREAGNLKTNFIRVASHELRTPLTILLGLSRIASQAPDLPAPARDRVTRMRSAAERLQHLVDQLISMLSNNTFDAQLERRPTDLAALLRQAASDVHPFVDLRHQTLVCHIPDSLGTLHLDPEKIRDSINHLLLNAIKFTPDKGTITLEASVSSSPLPPSPLPHSPIPQSEIPNPQSVTIRISDTGVGMSPSHLSHLFEPFFTGHDVSRHASGHYEFNRQGLGLGLSVVRAFIQQHGGSITAHSHPHQGSQFQITLPA